jgi:Spy/CpxP family protein refolding chaperone
MFEQLNLSADQQAQIKSIMEQTKTSNQGLRQQVKTVREQLKTVMGSSDASAKPINKSKPWGSKWASSGLKPCSRFAVF